MSFHWLALACHGRLWEKCIANVFKGPSLVPVKDKMLNNVSRPVCTPFSYISWESGSLQCLVVFSVELGE